MRILLICAALVAAAYGCSDMVQRRARISQCQQDVLAEAQTYLCGAYRSFLSCARAAAAGCPALEAQLEQSIASMQVQISAQCDGNGPSPGGGNGPSPGGGNGPSPDGGNGQSPGGGNGPSPGGGNGPSPGGGNGPSPGGGNGPSPGGGNGPSPGGGNGPSPGQDCSGIELMNRLERCQQDMATQMQTNPCGAYHSFLSCARTTTAGCPALEAQLERTVAAMRAQLGGICDRNGPADSP